MTTPATLPEATLQIAVLTEMLDKLTNILFNDASRAEDHRWDGIEEKAVEVAEEAGKHHMKHLTTSVVLLKNGEFILMRKDGTILTKKDGSEWEERELVSGDLSGATKKDWDVLMAENGRLFRCNEELTTERESYKHALEKEEQKAIKSDGILSSVCNTLFEDEERASTHGYDGVEEKAKDAICYLEKLREENAVLTTGYNRSAGENNSLKRIMSDKLDGLLPFYRACARKAAKRIEDESRKQEDKDRSGMEFMPWLGTAPIEDIILEEITGEKREVPKDAARKLVDTFLRDGTDWVSDNDVRWRSDNSDPIKDLDSAVEATRNQDKGPAIMTQGMLLDTFRAMTGTVAARVAAVESSLQEVRNAICSDMEDTGSRLIALEERAGIEPPLSEAVKKLAEVPTMEARISHFKAVDVALVSFPNGLHISLTKEGEIKSSGKNAHVTLDWEMPVCSQCGRDLLVGDVKSATADGPKYCDDCCPF